MHSSTGTSYVLCGATGRVREHSRRRHVTTALNDKQRHSIREIRSESKQQTRAVSDVAVFFCILLISTSVVVFSAHLAPCTHTPMRPCLMQKCTTVTRKTLSPTTQVKLPFSISMLCTRSSCLDFAVYLQVSIIICHICAIYSTRVCCLPNLYPALDFRLFRARITFPHHFVHLHISHQGHLLFHVPSIAFMASSLVHSSLLIQAIAYNLLLHISVYVFHLCSFHVPPFAP